MWGFLKDTCTSCVCQVLHVSVGKSTENVDVNCGIKSKFIDLISGYHVTCRNFNIVLLCVICFTSNAVHIKK